ncbi:MAG: XDD3 family exosortase-dependent surface protein [Geitlerinemataceae cyanobacterium]
MNTKKPNSTAFGRSVIKPIALTLGICVSGIQAANASSLKALNTGAVSNIFKECLNDGMAVVYDDDRVDNLGWYYAFDSAIDGVSGDQIGGNGYEIYGSAIKETQDSIVVVLNSNMLITGQDGTAADDGNIGWGDWFLNLSGMDFTTASNTGNLFAVRFAGTNDSLAPSVGLYGGVTATSVTGINAGFESLNAYHDRVATHCTNGICTNLGDLSANTAYFDQNQSLNSIGSGTYLSEITYLSLAELQAEGYNSSQFGGSQTIAFTFNKTAICQSGNCQSVPDPSSLLGVFVVGLGMKFIRRNRTAE